jgi:DNA polymerase-3 subunit delta
VILKSYIVEQDVSVLENYQATLIYGQNNGIKEDIKQKIRDKNNNSEIIIFFEEELLKNKNILFQNIVNESLFNEKKIIFIYEASDKIFDQVYECLEKENKNIKINIFSHNLEKKSKLRNLFEKNTNLAIFPCYEDNERTLIAYINKELKEYKGLTGEIINLIIYNSNTDRRIIKSELVKIKYFFLNKKITKEEIFEILNIKDDTSFDKIRDSALSGDKIKINKLLSEMELLNVDAFFYLNSLNYRVMKLQEVIRISDGKSNRYEQALESLKPPIFWKDKPIIVQQLHKWNLKKLSQVAEEIGETEILMKKNSYFRCDIIIKRLLINLTSRASSISSS